MESPEVHVPHPSHTGHRWWDFAIGGTALLVSLISLYIAVHHGQIMERLVAANSWPNVEVSINVVTGATPAAARFEIALNNNGIGPARVETLELWSDKNPIANADQVGKLIKAAGGGGRFTARVDGSTVLGHVVGAREGVKPLAIEAGDGGTWATAMAVIGNSIESRVCYCSVFDECYRADSRNLKHRPDKVDSCPVPAVPYNDSLTALVLSRQE